MTTETIATETMATETSATTKTQTHQQQSQPTNQVTIIGGGLVGFSLALMLAKQGIASTLLEAKRLPDISDAIDTTSYISLDSRNTALSRKTVQIFTELGLWETLQSHAMPILQVEITEQGSFGKARLKADEENVESFGQVMENRWFGMQLLKAARDHHLITLIDEAVITMLSQSEAAATIRYEKDNHTQQISTDLLIAADGQHSFCRQALNIATNSKDYGQTAVVAVVETSKPHQQIGYERFSEHGPLALLPLAGKTAGQQNRRSVVWIAKTGEESQYLGEENDTHFLKTLQQAFGDRAGEFLRAGKRGSYPLSQVLAEQQVVGRVVVLGNAAHTLHPVAGQGFNLCLRDAYALTQQLEFYLSAHQDFSGFQLLNRSLMEYEQARLIDQKRVITFCDGVVRGFTNSNPLLKFTRNAGLLAFDTIPGMKQLVANYAMGLKS